LSSLITNLVLHFSTWHFYEYSLVNRISIRWGKIKKYFQFSLEFPMFLYMKRMFTAASEDVGLKVAFFYK
jgi:hypothetical protein